MQSPAVRRPTQCLMQLLRGLFGSQGEGSRAGSIVVFLPLMTTRGKLLLAVLCNCSGGEPGESSTLVQLFSDQAGHRKRNLRWNLPVKCYHRWLSAHWFLLYEPELQLWATSSTEKQTRRNFTMVSSQLSPRETSVTHYSSDRKFWDSVISHKTYWKILSLLCISCSYEMTC